MVEISCHGGCEYSCLLVNSKRLLTDAMIAVLKEESLEFGLDLKVRDREADCLQKKKTTKRVPTHFVEIGSWL